MRCTGYRGVDEADVVCELLGQLIVAREGADAGVEVDAPPQPLLPLGARLHQLTTAAAQTSQPRATTSLFHLILIPY